MTAGIPVFIDAKPELAHNKLIIIDRQVVIGGSYNYTRAAEEDNAENVTVLKSGPLANLFLRNWQSRLAVSTRFPAKK